MWKTKSLKCVRGYKPFQMIWEFWRHYYPQTEKMQRCIDVSWEWSVCQTLLQECSNNSGRKTQKETWEKMRMKSGPFIHPSEHNNVISELTDPEGKPRHLSSQCHSPDHPGDFKVLIGQVRFVLLLSGSGSVQGKCNSALNSPWMIELLILSHKHSHCTEKAYFRNQNPIYARPFSDNSTIKETKKIQIIEVPWLQGNEYPWESMNKRPFVISNLKFFLS